MGNRNFVAGESNLEKMPGQVLRHDGDVVQVPRHEAAQPTGRGGELCRLQIVAEQRGQSGARMLVRPWLPSTLPSAPHHSQGHDMEV